MYEKVLFKKDRVRRLAPVRDGIVGQFKFLLVLAIIFTLKRNAAQIEIIKNNVLMLSINFVNFPNV